MLLTCDVAFSHFGWVAIDGEKPIACGVIETEKTKRKGILVSNDYFARSTKLVSELESVISTYSVKGILAELPSGGAKSSRAAIQMNMATGLVAAVAHFMKLPSEFCTPGDVKMATVGSKSASKLEIMDFVIEYFGGKKIIKNVKCRTTAKCPEGIRIDSTYHFLGQKFGVGKFEHIADALGVWIYLKNNGNLIRLFDRVA